MEIVGSEKPSLEDLVHFGVKGMKWGVRKQNPGLVGRTARRIATSKTQSQINLHNKALQGKGLIGLAAKLDKHTWGRKGRFEGYHNKRISELNRSKDRIAEGDLVVKTILFGAQYSKPKR